MENDQAKDDYVDPVMIAQNMLDFLERNLEKNCLDNQEDGIDLLRRYVLVVKMGKRPSPTTATLPGFCTDEVREAMSRYASTILERLIEEEGSDFVLKSLNGSLSSELSSPITIKYNREEWADGREVPSLA